MITATPWPELYSKGPTNVKSYARKVLQPFMAPFQRKEMKSLVMDLESGVDTGYLNQDSSAERMAVSAVL